MDNAGQNNIFLDGHINYNNYILYTQLNNLYFYYQFLSKNINQTSGGVIFRYIKKYYCL